MAAFLVAPIFAKYGGTFGPKRLYNLGAVLQSLAGIAFGFLEYIDHLQTFIGLSYFLR